MSFVLELEECVVPLSASLSGDNVVVRGVSIDTRTLKPGELYVAIKGEQFDGHEFVQAAQDAGAAAIMVHNDVDSQLPQLRVANTQAALGQLGKFWAKRFSIPTIAVTGSNGKTTVKEILTSILQQLGPVLATKGNLNNELGVPLTLLRMQREHIYAVVEMGASHAGEIARLVALAEPDVCIVTNIGTAHLEGFGSVDGIAAAKSEIFAGLKPGGYGVVNADDHYAKSMRDACAHCLKREFGMDESADVYPMPGNELVIAASGHRLAPRFRLAGEHNLMNALAAVAAVQCLDVQSDSIIAGLEAVSAVPGRLEVKQGLEGALIIDDSYNANPDSARSAIKVLSGYQGSRFLVLGDMGELGSDAEKLHQAVGEFAQAQGIDGLWTTGVLSSAIREKFVESHIDTAELPGAHFADHETLLTDLRAHLSSDTTVLVKGSRSAHMERVVQALVSAPATPTAGARA